MHEYLCAALRVKIDTCTHHCEGEADNDRVFHQCIIRDSRATSIIHLAGDHQTHWLRALTAWDNNTCS